ncbi:MAG: primosomal protein N', partial [Clostridium sp.]
MSIASVIISNSSREVDREFDYNIPEELEEFISIGSSVVVPFGKYNSYTEGFVVSIKQFSSFEGGTLKKIVDIVDEDMCISKELMNLARYIKDEYLCTLSDALNLMLPPKKGIKQVINIEFLSFCNDNSKKEMEILEFIKDKGIITLDKIRAESKYKVSFADLLRLQKKGCIVYVKDFIKGKNDKEVILYSIEDYNLCLEFINDPSNRAKKQIELVKQLINYIDDEFEPSEIIERFSTSSAIIKGLVTKGILKKTHKRVFRHVVTDKYTYEKPPLTSDQLKAIDSVIDSYRYGKTTSLIHGVTSCGKTEIYLNLVEKFLMEEYGSIIMVPEISLTPQTIERFRGRFGDNVAILHSRLTEGERYDQYIKIKNGEYKVVIGARSAVFAPVMDLKLIIIDEEHEYSYKSECSPRYLTHKVAEFRVNQLRGVLVLGSATPCIESYYRAKIGEYNLITIDKRVKDMPMPRVEVIDMKDELMIGNKSMFSRKLYNGLKETLDDKMQTILFLNRRGFSTFVSCRKCGYVCECDSCSVTLTYHQGMDKLKCHHCSRQYNIPSICPKCSSKYIKYFGVGTQKVEKETISHFKS